MSDLRPTPASIVALLVMLISGLSGIARADQTPEQIAADAYTAYTRSDWPRAIQGYKTLVGRGIADPVLYCNLAEAYAQSGDRGRAIWMLLRARRLDPRDRDVRDNLNVLAPDLLSQLAVLPVPPLDLIFGSFTVNEWAALGGTAAVLGGVFLAAFFLVPRKSLRRGWFRRLSIATLTVAALGHTFAWIKYQDETTSRGVIIAANTLPLSAPHETASTLPFNLPPGSVVRVEPAGVKGWIKGTYGGRIEFFILADQIAPLTS